MEEFVKIYKPQLEAMGLPPELYNLICKKLVENILDASDYIIFAQEEMKDNDSTITDSLHDISMVKVEENLVDASIQMKDITDLDILFPLQPYKIYSKQRMRANSTVLLIDHMWITTFPQSRNQLKVYDSLQQRICSALGIEPSDNIVDKLWDHIWPHLNCFHIPGEDYMKWYLMDEVGLSIQHSNEPNFRCCPLLVQPIHGEPSYTITIAWPIKDIEESEKITRDYLIGVPKSKSSYDFMKDIWMLAFQYPQIINKLSSNPTLCSFYHSQIEILQSMVSIPSNKTAENTMEISSALVRNHWVDTLEKLRIKSSENKPLKLFCDRWDHLNEHLIVNKNHIEIVMIPEDADILYLIDHTINYTTLDEQDVTTLGNTVDTKGSNSNHHHHSGFKEYNKTNKITSQYCWNILLITKEALLNTIKTAHRIVNCSVNPNSSTNVVAINSKKTGNDTIFPSWFPDTYDLTKSNELIEFITEYMRIQSSCKFVDNNCNNYWILKKHRGKQSIDYPISNNLPCLLRHCELSERLASKYILNPLLLQHRKFDLRYHVLVRSLEPLVILRHEVFLIRWANYNYSNDNFEEYQKHFTVMNFLNEEEAILNSQNQSNRLLENIRGTGKRQNLRVADFCRFFDEEYAKLYPDDMITWKDTIQPKIDRVIRELFEYVRIAFYDNMELSTKYHPNAAWSLSQEPNIAQACSMFGVDIIVDSKFQPMILEVQWAPDCARAVELHPSFWDDVLTGLYRRHDDDNSSSDNCCNNLVVL